MWQGFDAEARRQIEQDGRYAMPSEYDSEEPYIITRKLIEDVAEKQARLRAMGWGLRLSS